MLGNNFTGGVFDASYSNTVLPTSGRFFLNKDLIVLEKLNANKSENIDYFFKSQISNCKS